MDTDNQILLALGRLEGKVDAMLTHQQLQGEELEKHDLRIRKLEQGRSWLLGAAAVIASAFTFIATKLGV